MVTDKIKKLERKLKGLQSKPDAGASGKKKVDTLNELAEALRKSDHERAEVYANRALTLARELDYEKALAVSHRILCWPCFVKGEYASALGHCKKALRIFKKVGDKLGIASVYVNTGIVYTAQGSIRQAQADLFKALDIFRKVDDKEGMASVYTEIGNTHYNDCDFAKAMSYSLKALKLYEKTGEKRGLAVVYANIGNIHGERNEYDQSLECSFKALKIFTELGEKANMAAACTNIGCTYMDQRDFDKGLEYHRQAMEINEELDRKVGIASCYGNMAQCYKEQGAYDKALENCLAGLAICEKIGWKKGIASCCNNIGLLHTEMGQYDSALQYLKKGLQLAREIGAKITESNIYDNISIAYENQKDFKQALKYRKRYARAKVDILNSEKSRQITEMRTKYETEKKEKEVEISHLKNVELRDEIRKRRKTEEELKKHRDQLEALVQERTAQLRSLAHELSLVEEKQRRKIATYLHDEVNQKLALAAFKLDGIEKVKSVARIRKEHREIKKIIDQATQLTRSLTFEISPPILYEFGLESAIDWLVRQFSKQLRIPCEFKDDGAPKPVTDDTRVLLFQSVRELLANVSKHACASNVRVSAARDDNVIRIKVEDDGIGFDPKVLSEKIVHNEGFGLFNVRERLQHMRGRLEIRSKKGHGTSVVIVAPLRNVKKRVGKQRQ